MTIPPRSEQAARLYAAKNGAMTMAEAGAMFGLTRQAVSSSAKRKMQGLLLGKYEVPMPYQHWPSGPVMAKYYKISLNTLWRILRKRGVAGQAKAHFQSVRDQKSRAHWMDRIKSLALSLNHTPRLPDLRAAGINPSRLTALFGKTSQAMIAVGLTPNRPYTPAMPLPEDWTGD